MGEHGGEASFRWTLAEGHTGGGQVPHDPHAQALLGLHDRVPDRRDRPGSALMCKSLCKTLERVPLQRPADKAVQGQAMRRSTLPVPLRPFT